jgi:DNA polymerase V
MGDPWHIVSKHPAIKPVIWMSSNYALYGDMSRRMYELLVDMAPAVEPYSIDEMFLDLAGVPEPARLAAKIRDHVRRVAKIPTCVGIGPTKTIAKLANKMAKSYRLGSGICDFSTPEQRAPAYAEIEISDVWGIGPASVLKLKKLGISTVADFLAMPQEEVRGLMTVVGARTHAELSGVSCIPFSDAPATRKSLAVTRSFGRAVTDWQEMEQAVASYATRAGEKLRSHGLMANAMQVFMRTNEFNNDPKYANQATFGIEPTSDTLSLIRDALRAARRLWIPGYRYAKAGIVLVDLSLARNAAAGLFPSLDPEKSARLMSAVDAINVRYGRRTLNPARAGFAQGWSMRRQNLSPRYTTDADEMMIAVA